MSSEWGSVRAQANCTSVLRLFIYLLSLFSFFHLVEHGDRVSRYMKLFSSCYVEVCLEDIVTVFLL